MTAKQFEVAIQKDVNKEYPQDNKAGESTRCAYVKILAKTGYSFTCITSNKAAKLLASTQIVLRRSSGDYVRWRYLITAPTFPLATYTITGVHASTAEIAYADGTNIVEKYHVHLPFTIVVRGTGVPSITAQDSSNSNSASITCKLVVTGTPAVTNTGSGSYSEAGCSRAINVAG
jgi:hypothetical protein